MDKHVLIVDDDRDLMLLFLEYLSDWDGRHKVETAYSGEEALTKMTTSSFDLIITDLYMPGVDGLVLIEYAREHLSNTPLGLMTSCKWPEIEAAAYELGIYLKLNKPFSRKEFLRVVQQALKSSDLGGI